MIRGWWEGGSPYHWWRDGLGGSIGIREKRGKSGETISCEHHREEGSRRVVRGWWLEIIGMLGYASLVKTVT